MSTEVFAHLPVHETVEILPEEVMQFGTNNLTLVGNSSFSGGLTLATGATGILGIVSDTALGTGALTVNETATLATFGEMRSIANDVVLASGKTLILGAANGDLTFTGAISSSGALNKTGTKNLTLTGNSTFSGGLTIATGATGTLAIGSDTALGAGTLTVNETATLATSGAARSIANNVAVAAGKTLTFNTTAGDLAISGEISGTTAHLTKTGANNLLLTGASVYTGVTFVSSGALITENDSALGASSAIFVAGPGRALQIGNAGSNALTLAPGAQLYIGNGSFLRLGGLNSASLDGAQAVITLNGTHDFNTSGGLDLNGVLNNLTLGDHTYTLLSAGSPPVNSLVLANIIGFDSSVTNLSYHGDALSFTSVPESSTYGLVAAASVVRRKRRIRAR